MSKPRYSLAVDKHIYIRSDGGAETNQEWFEVALAALDQANFSRQWLICFAERVVVNEGGLTYPNWLR